MRWYSGIEVHPHTDQVARYSCATISSGAYSNDGREVAARLYLLDAQAQTDRRAPMRARRRYASTDRALFHCSMRSMRRAYMGRVRKPDRAYAHVRAL